MLQEDCQNIGSASSEPSRHTPASSLEVTINNSAENGTLETPAPKKNKKKEVRAQHSIHDRLQMESNFTFDLRPRAEEEQQRVYKIDTYLFLPNSMGVNSSNFDAEEFFRHRTSYFRVRAPLFHHLRTIEPSELRFESADEYFQGHLSSIERGRLGGKVVQDVKLFGNFLYTEFKKVHSKIRGKRTSLKERRKRELAQRLLHRAELLWAFRERYLSPIREQRYLLDEEVIRAFMLTDEYLSYRVELVLLKAKQVLTAHSERLEAFLGREMEYRKQHRLLVLGEKEQEPVTFEAYTYRLGLLKKYLGEALFLQLESNKKDRFYKNVAAAIGAGLAATIMGFAEHQRVQYLTGNDSGIRLAFLIGVAVVAYIFKDRVKDLTKEYFNSRLKERLPDESFELSHRGYTQEGQENVRDLGTVSEYFRFLKEIPADVLYLRTLRQVRTNDPERREHVVHLGRRLKLNLKSKDHRKLFPLLKNVLRMDISPFLSKLDNPTTPINFVGAEGGAKTVNAPKVYHLNMVLRYEIGFDDGSRLVDYERVRLILNKNGIVRLERVLEQGTLSYEVPGE